jgi:hypothetical protein
MSQGGLTMANRHEVFTKINVLLEGTDYPTEIKEMSDLEDFLNDVENQQYDEYDEIERLYDELMDDDSDFEEE